MQSVADAPPLPLDGARTARLALVSVVLVRVSKWLEQEALREVVPLDRLGKRWAEALDVRTAVEALLAAVRVSEAIVRGGDPSKAERRAAETIRVES